MSFHGICACSHELDVPAPPRPAPPAAAGGAHPSPAATDGAHPPPAAAAAAAAAAAWPRQKAEARGPAAGGAAAAAAGWRWEWCGTGEKPAEPGSGAGRARGRGHCRPAYCPPPIFGRLRQGARRRGVRPGSVESAGVQFLPSLSSHARARARTRECTALGVFNSTGCLRHVAAARGQSR